MTASTKARSSSPGIIIYMRKISKRKTTLPPMFYNSSGSQSTCPSPIPCTDPLVGSLRVPLGHLYRCRKYSTFLLLLNSCRRQHCFRCRCFPSKRGRTPMPCCQCSPRSCGGLLYSLDRKQPPPAYCWDRCPRVRALSVPPSWEKESSVSPTPAGRWLAGPLVGPSRALVSASRSPAVRCLRFELNRTCLYFF